MKIADVTTVVVTSTIVGPPPIRAWPAVTTSADSPSLAVVLILIGALAGAATLMLNQWIGTP